ncbi:MAG: hypothetical protein RL609_1762 [Bacteroidota bacterium]
MKRIFITLMSFMILQACQPDSPNNPSGLKGYLREYGTDNPIVNGQVYLLRYSDYSTSGQYQSTAQTTTNAQGYFEIEDTHDASLFYAKAGDQHIDLGVNTSSTFTPGETIRTFYLYGKAWTRFAIQDTGEVNAIAGISVYPMSNLSMSQYILNDVTPSVVLPALGLASNQVAYQVNFADGTQGPFTYLNFLNAAPQDTLAVSIFY